MARLTRRYFMTKNAQLPKCRNQRLIVKYCQSALNRGIAEESMLSSNTEELLEKNFEVRKLIKFLKDWTRRLCSDESWLEHFTTSLFQLRLPAVEETRPKPQLLIK